jgi:hypothetical protein
MPPWRKGRGLGPFTSAQPAAGLLPSSQPHGPQTTQNTPMSTLWSVAITLLTIGYMIARGLAKSGSHGPYDDDRR